MINSPFAATKKQAVPRFLSQEDMTHRIYFYNPEDDKMMAEEADYRGLLYRINKVSGQQGATAFTRYINLTAEDFQKAQAQGFNGMARQKEGERIVAISSLSTDQMITEEVVKPKDHLKGMNRSRGEPEPTW